MRTIFPGVLVRRQTNAVSSPPHFTLVFDQCKTLLIADRSYQVSFGHVHLEVIC